MSNRLHDAPDTNILDTSDRAYTHLPRGVAGVGPSKVTRYKWAVASNPGEFRMIPKGLLHIDGRYQRDAVSETKVRTIAAEWDYRLLGAISVMERQDGTYWVFEGGHRTRASFLRSDVLLLPCMVFRADDLSDEARAFVGANTLSNAVRAGDKHRAAVIAGEPIAVFAAAILDRFGYKVSSTFGAQYGFDSVAALQSCCSRDPDLAEKTFAACVEIAESPGEHIPSMVLKTLFVLGQRYGATVVFGERCMAAMKEYGLQGLVSTMRREVIRQGKGGEKVWVGAVLTVLNKGRRRKLEPVPVVSVGK